MCSLAALISRLVGTAETQGLTCWWCFRPFCLDSGALEAREAELGAERRARRQHQSELKAAEARVEVRNGTCH